LKSISPSLYLNTWAGWALFLIEWMNIAIIAQILVLNGNNRCYVASFNDFKVTKSTRKHNPYIFIFSLRRNCFFSSFLLSKVPLVRSQNNFFFWNFVWLTSIFLQSNHFLQKEHATGMSLTSKLVLPVFNQFHCMFSFLILFPSVLILLRYYFVSILMVLSLSFLHFFGRIPLNSCVLKSWNLL
jgi:hypothetical protein